MITEPFVPIGQTQVLTPSNSSSTNVQLPVPAPSQNFKYTVRVRNRSAAEVFIAFGQDNSITATTGGIPIAPNSVEIFAVPATSDQPGPLTSLWIAAITDFANSGKIYFTLGKGL